MAPGSAGSGWIAEAGSANPAKAGSARKQELPRTADEGQRHASQGEPFAVLRRFRQPLPARVTLTADGRPARVVVRRTGFTGATVRQSAGPWRTSGEWWRGERAAAAPSATFHDDGSAPGAAIQIGGRHMSRSYPPAAAAVLSSPARSEGARPERASCDVDPRTTRVEGWDREEWDVALDDGAVYRVSRDVASGEWVVEGYWD